MGRRKATSANSVVVVVALAAGFLIWKTWQGLIVVTLIIAGIAGLVWLIWGVMKQRESVSAAQSMPKPPPQDERTLVELLRDKERAPHVVPQVKAASPVARVQPARVEVQAYQPPDVAPPAESAAKHPPTEAHAPRWIRFGESVTLPRGQVIKGGGFYFGMPRGRMRRSAALVDPTLTVRFDGIDWVGSSLSYWPQYHELQPRDRGAFVGYLNSERSSPAVGVGFAFIYFYGIEERLLDDCPRDPQAAEEAPQLLAEVERLQAVYPESASMRRYSRELLSVASWVTGLHRWEGIDPVPLSDGWSTGLRWGLGQLVAEQRPLPARWAFAWARAVGEQPRGITWDPVMDELVARFEQLYRERWPIGLLVPPPKSRLVVEYQWAAPGRERQMIDTGVPDLSRLQAAVRPLVGMAALAMTDLEALRRVRRSKLRSDAGELAAMPPTLRGSFVPAGLAHWHQQLQASLVKEPIVARPIRALAEALGIAPAAKLSKRDAMTLAQGLEALGIGMEPDPRFHGDTPGVDDEAQLFVLTRDAERAPSPAYGTVLLVVQAAMAVGEANDGLSEAELSAALAAVESQFALSHSERVRIEAHIAWLQQRPPAARRLATRLKALPVAHRDSLAHVVLSVANADGYVAPAEVILIERFYAALGLNPASVPADLHRTSVGQTRGQATPRIDADVVAAKLAETAQVQSVLAEIFADTPADAPVVLAVTVPVDAALPGLSASHATLLRLVLAFDAPELDRGAWEALCAEQDLLPDGAQEILNEFAFDLAGEALMEGDDPLEINSFARDTLRENLANQDGT